MVPDPAGRARELAALAERRTLLAALGPSVPWRRAAVSWRRAQATHALASRGALGVTGRCQAPSSHGGLVRADDHPELLVLAADPELAAELSARMLAPLDGLTARQRERFAATLGAWLGHRGALKPISAELGVHPQTVRYRVSRLRELFGEAALDDPRTRFQLELALRARALA